MSYIIQQTYNENAKNNQVEVVILFQHEILVTNLQGGGGERVNNQILEVWRLRKRGKSWTYSFCMDRMCSK